MTTAEMGRKNSARAGVRGYGENVRKIRLLLLRFHRSRAETIQLKDARIIRPSGWETKQKTDDWRRFSQKESKCGANARWCGEFVAQIITV
ncbi:MULTISPECIES: hypothetical protein [Serratia]|uniref:Uncharacterized protein n=1 Tax=Serratia rubidaea TaxID=61652 RepID=A0ABS0MIX2_SERRU|nr:MULTISPECIES: hypothetical protein [Serratia]MBD8451925.1 hypothetical protein [Serratia rubidaea]MBH1932310.1 hypothetical protein [Serratia rubidaea]MBS0974563.1 hypothetical protein [Serratia rubidaea]MCR0998380.1 hypothetical protein [Serratia rubidaea]MDC6111045.1 hypothetical protein [Serratia rubidaea]